MSNTQQKEIIELTSENFATVLSQAAMIESIEQSSYFFDDFGLHIPNHLFEINSIGKVTLLFD